MKKKEENIDNIASDPNQDFGNIFQNLFENDVIIEKPARVLNDYEAERVLWSIFDQESANPLLQFSKGVISSSKDKKRGIIVDFEVDIFNVFKSDQNFVL